MTSTNDLGRAYNILNEALYYKILSYDDGVVSLNKKLDAIYDKFYNIVKNGAKRVNEDVFPNYYKISEYGNDFYLEQAKESLKDEINKLYEAIEISEE